VNQSRRQFLKSTSAGLGALAVLPRTWSDPAARSAAASGPRLMFDASDLPRIRATLDRPEFAAFWQSSKDADLAADEHFLREELNPANLLVDLHRASTILQRSAFVHLMAPDPRHLRLALLAWERIMNVPRWDWFFEAGTLTVGIMRCPMLCLATILACDWLGDALNPGERERLVRRLGEEHGPACHRAVLGMTHHDQVVGWTMGPPAPGMDILDVSRWPATLDQTNLRVIATSGLAAVAAFLKDQHPASGQWAEESRASLRLFASRMPADMSFAEGISYWDFTWTYYFAALELLRRTHGFDERGVLDFPAMARYALAMAAPTRGQVHDCINVGDAFTSGSATPLAWIGREFRDGTAQALVARPGAVADAANSCWAAIWFDASVPARLAGDIRLDRQVAPGLVLSRSGWEPADSVVSLRSGGPANHEHADRNSVIFIAHGERLLHDPFHASYSNRDPRWLLRQTAAHTAVLIDGRGHVYIDGTAGTHDSPAKATLLDYDVGLDWMRATSDATDAYRRAGLPVRRVWRTVVFLKPEIIVFFDEISLEKPLAVQTRFQVMNEDGLGRLATNDRGFRIDRPGAAFEARVASLALATISAGRLDLPAAGGIYPYAEVTAAAALEHRILTVGTAAPAGAEHGRIELVAGAAEFTAQGSHRGREFLLKLARAANGRTSVVF